MAWNPKSMGNRNKLIYNFTIQAYQKLILSALGLITCVNIMLKCTLSMDTLLHLEFKLYLKLEN